MTVVRISLACCTAIYMLVALSSYYVLRGTVVPDVMQAYLPAQFVVIPYIKAAYGFVIVFSFPVMSFSCRESVHQLLVARRKPPGAPLFWCTPCHAPPVALSLDPCFSSSRLFFVCFAAPPGLHPRSPSQPRKGGAAADGGAPLLHSPGSPSVNAIPHQANDGATSQNCVLRTVKRLIPYLVRRVGGCSVVAVANTHGVLPV